MYKIIFIDIDGTLRNDKKEITNRTKVAIHKIVEKEYQLLSVQEDPDNIQKR